MGKTVTIYFENNKVSRVTGTRSAKVKASAAEFGAAFVEAADAPEKQAAPTFPRRCTRCTRPATHYVKDEPGVTEGVSGDLLCGRHAAKCGLPTRGLPPSWRVSTCIECARMPKRGDRCPVCAYLIDNGVPAQP